MRKGIILTVEQKLEHWQRRAWDAERSSTACYQQLMDASEENRHLREEKQVLTAEVYLLRERLKQCETEVAQYCELITQTPFMCS